MDIKELNAKPIDELLKVLESGQAVLMAGAGCSVDLGYPDWPSLVSILKEELSPSLELPENIDIKDIADIVKRASYERHDFNHEPYERKIEEIFEPRRSNYKIFHQHLVRMGFAGIATTNYDTVMESAVISSYGDYTSNCRSLNLCDNKKHYKILDFFRRLGENPCPYVLHLHGSYDQADRVVLTRTDYEFYYNNCLRSASENDRRRKKPEDTLHRRTIWALLSTRVVVFVGFSMNDPYFCDVINVWRTDLKLFAECPHFAFIGISSIEDAKSDMEELRTLGVKPIFYEVPDKNPSDHRGLHFIIAKLAEQRGVRDTGSSVNEISQRTLDMQ